MRNSLAILSFLCLGGSMSCIGNAKTSLRMDSANYPISASSFLSLPSQDGDDTQRMTKVAKFEIPFNEWSMVYGLVRLNPVADLSNAINTEVEKTGGNSIINFRVEAQGCLLNGAPLFSLLPFWPSCVEGKVTGDIVRN